MVLPAVTLRRRAARLCLPLAGLCAAASPGVAAAAQRVLYVNTGAQTLVNSAGNDPSQNSFSVTGYTPGNVDGWVGATPAQIEEMVYWIKEATLPFDIVVVTQRPTTPGYDMIVFGTAANHAASFGGACSTAIGLADCNDADQGDISFIFWECLNPDDRFDPKRVAFTALTAAGFSWGLENVTVSGQIMGTYSATGLRFGEACVPVSGTPRCAHNMCAAGQQNSSADITGLIGARVDDGPPVVSIVQPVTGSDVSGNFVVEAAVDDAFGGLTVELEIVEVSQSLAKALPPYRWELNGVPAGQYTLRVNATDADGNLASAESVVCVGGATCDGGGSTSTTDPTAGTATEPTSTTDDTGASTTDDTGASTTDTTTGGETGDTGSDVTTAAPTTTATTTATTGPVPPGGGFTTGSTRESEDSGCAVQRDGAAGHGPLGLAFGLLLGAWSFAGRRRRRAA
jgi:hypothetical protein